ncbi:MAG: YfjI family protein [Pirellulales bacterium]
MIRQDAAKSDSKEIERAVKLLFSPGSVVEVRCLTGKRTTGGYFNDYAALVKAAAGITTGNVYITINEVDPALLARRANRIDYADSTTADHNITHRRWMLVDCDCQRPSGISATDDEHEAAIATARAIGKAMVALGWPKPILADSGNGAHLLFRIDLPNDRESAKLVERLLAQLGIDHDDDAECSPRVKVDQTVYNASRICKLYGTVARKGDPTADRPHRLSKLLFVPDAIDVVTREQLERYAGPEPPAPQPKKYQGNGHADTFDLRVFIAQNLQVRSEGAYTNSNGAVHRWRLETCPLCCESDNSAVVLQYGDGRIGYRCHHNRCLRMSWADLREKFQPGYRDRREQQRARGADRSGMDDLRPEREKPQPAREVIRYERFPTSALPKPLRGFVVAAAKAIGCDPSYVALPLMTACAAAIGNTRRLRIKAGWTEPPILWTVIVGESGAGKTPPLKLALTALRARQGKAIKLHAEAMAEYEIDLAHWEKAHAEWKKKTKDAGEPPEKPPIPLMDRCIVSDCTVESLAPILLANPRGLLLVRDELAGWIGSFDRYAAKGSADAAHWLSMNSGENIIVDRKTGFPRTIFVPRAAVSVTGGIQPAILERALGREHRESGLAARLLLAYPPRIVKRWTEAGIDPAVEKRIENLIERLYELQPTYGDDDEPRSVVIEMDAAARALWIEFYDSHNAEAVDLEGDLSAAWSKLEAYAARLALVVHFVRWAANDPALGHEARVDAVSLASALELIRWFKNECRRVYGMFGESDGDRECRELINLIDRLSDPIHGITPNDLRRRSRRFATSEGAEQALVDLVSAGFGEWHVPTPDQGGRPTRYFRLVSSVSVSDTPSNPEENEGLGYGYNEDSEENDLAGDNPWGQEWEREEDVEARGWEPEEEVIEL